MPSSSLRAAIIWSSSASAILALSAIVAGFLYRNAQQTHVGMFMVEFWFRE